MKKNLFFLLLLALAAMSCQKDIGNTYAFSSVESRIKSAYDSQTFEKQTDESKADEKRIVEFSKLLDELKTTSSASLTGSEMPVAETVWNVEALLNASYASAGDPFKYSSMKKDSVLVPLNVNGAVDASSLPAVYESLRVKLAQQYTAVSSANKHLVFIDIELKGIRNTVNLANPDRNGCTTICSCTDGSCVPNPNCVLSTF